MPSSSVTGAWLMVSTTKVTVPVGVSDALTPATVAVKVTSCVG